MNDTALIQLVRELDALKKDLSDLKEQLRPVFDREARLQEQEQRDRENPFIMHISES